ncbi:LytTR family DNA-binding domain-containing protein [Ichthyenterobacterium sp. W332]|uniref:LytTR family DNA-binding domain-containing protein n=1 Tax=Microcosmobacter mediterraneus TaxID=3075607 RepID=A0ABU2YHC2_9FLAO|nr:LytTR family DNA-binding domain-containing protein [Ichthyenterobacterium sp. W332]MDT0557573.1 LytTR family DNA-binding domain-containing protein [Ichthyenterobacterium sp. W332]
MTCIIIDDEPLAVSLLESYVSKIEDLTLKGAYNNPLDALKILREEPVDLLFLDIQMPEITGVEFKKIISPDVKVIFTTAYSEYALESYELNAVDYLLKPITFQRFLKAVEKVQEKNNTAEVETKKDYLFVKTEYRHQKIFFSEILYLKGLSDYVAIQTKDGKVLTLQNMKDFEQSLPKSKFIRVHKSYIISLEHIEFIERNRIVIKGEYIPIGATYKDAFWNNINN